DTEVDNDDISFFGAQSPAFRSGANTTKQSNPNEWQDTILTELAAQATSSSEAAAILDCIEELAESLLAPISNPMSPEDLCALICEVLDLEQYNTEKVDDKNSLLLLLTYL
ncbi:hypothetical protein BVRB_041390, partial [Beta vulgaris subsp. vulgaris]